MCNSVASSVSNYLPFQQLRCEGEDIDEQKPGTSVLREEDEPVDLPMAPDVQPYPPKYAYHTDFQIEG